MRTVHRKKIDTCPVFKRKNYREGYISPDPISALPIIKPMYLSNELRLALTEIKTRMKESNEEEKTQLAKEGLRLTMISLGYSPTVNKLKMPVQKQFNRVRRHKGKGAKLSPHIQFSEKVCTVHPSEHYRIYIQRTKNHNSKNGKIYEYPVLLCRLCENKKNRQRYRESKINTYTTLVGGK
jgi:hypothetical protein